MHRFSKRSPKDIYHPLCGKSIWSYVSHRKYRQKIVLPVSLPECQYEEVAGSRKEVTCGMFIVQVPLAQCKSLRRRKPSHICYHLIIVLTKAILVIWEAS